MTKKNTLTLTLLLLLFLTLSQSPLLLPCCTILSSEGGDMELRFTLRLQRFRILENPLKLTLQVENVHTSAVGVDKVKLIVEPFSQHHDVFRFRMMTNLVLIRAWDTGAAEHAGVLLHAEGNRVTDDKWLQLLRVEHRLEQHDDGREAGSTGGLLVSGNPVTLNETEDEMHWNLMKGNV